MASKKITTDIVKTADEEVVKDIVQQKKKKNNDRYLVHTNPGDNSKFLQNSLEISNLGRIKIDIHNAEETRNRITDYFNICIKNDMKPSVAGLALAFGITRQRLWERANGTGHQALEQEVIDEYQWAYVLLNAQMEDYMQNGKINPVSGIFLMKNNMGYQDRQEYIITPHTSAERSPEELIREANQLPDSDE